MQTCVRILTPLAGPRMAAALRQANTDLFSTYSVALAAAFERQVDAAGALPPALSARPCSHCQGPNYYASSKHFTCPTTAASVSVAR